MSRRIPIEAARALPKCLLALLSFLLLVSCGGESTPRNVLLVSIDTLRADYLGSYGFDRETTPAIDALAAEGTRFDFAISPVPLTLPAHSSMLTGTLPTRHGVHDNLGYALGEDSTTLAEILKGEGFATGAVVSSFVLDSRFNLAQGFDSYEDQFEEAHQIAFLNERKGDETTDFALRFLEAHRGERFFLFVHYYDPHDDYDPPEPFRSRFADDPYVGEVAFADAQVGRLIEKLQELDLDASTLVVVTGDHGEMLGEHGEPTHGFFVYQPAVRVPLLFRWPGGVAARVVPDEVGLIDIFPTVAGLLGLEVPSEVQGRDLSSLLSPGDPAPAPRRELFVESLTPSRYYGASPLFGLLMEEYKYIHAPRPELYDLSKDPGESVNLVAEHPRIAEGMRARLEEILAEGREAPSEASADEETRRRLATLGYLSGNAGVEDFGLDADGDDPKDWIDFYARHQRLEKLAGRGEHAEARRLAHELLEEHPGFTAGHLQLAQIATEERDLPRAIEHYEEALALDPENGGAHFNLGNLQAELGDYDAAIASFRAALEHDPGLSRAKERLDLLERQMAGAGRGLSSGAPSEADLRRALARDPSNGEAHYRLANLLAEERRWKEAAGHFRRALDAAPHSVEILHRLALAERASGELERALDHLSEASRLAPESAPIQSDLAGILKQLGRADEAAARYRRALELDPGLAVAWNDLGSLQGARGQVAEALESFRRAVAADDTHAVAHNNLGLALRMTGRRDEAIPHFERALELRPDWPVPLRELAWIRATHPDPSKRDPGQAVRLASRAREITSGREPVVLDTLAAAYAAEGRYELALSTASRAAALAEGRMPGLAAEIRRRAKLYGQNKPFLEPR